MQCPFEPEAPIDAGAASRNRPVWLLALLLAACGGAQESPSMGNETAVTADDGTWERLPAGARVRLDGILSGVYDSGGAGVSIVPHLCAHLTMTRREWQGLMQTARPLQRVTVYGSKTANHDYLGCLIQLDHVGIVAR